MWSVECVAKKPIGERASKRPPIFLLPSSQVATQAAQFQVEQLRKQWVVSEVQVQGDGANAECPFSCNVYCADDKGNATVYHIFVRHADLTIDLCQMAERLQQSPRAQKRSKSVMMRSSDDSSEYFQSPFLCSTSIGSISSDADMSPMSNRDSGMIKRIRSGSVIPFIL